jgi:multiple sugar transport system permease protein
VAALTAPVRVARARRRRPRIKVGRVLLYGVLIILALIFLLPFYIMVRNAFMTDPEITSPAFQFWPSTMQWGNFAELFSDPDVPILTGLRISGIMAVTHVVCQMLFASMAGYAMARIPFRYRNVVFLFVLGTLMIPGAVTFVPLYLVVSSLGWVNTLQGLIVPGLFSSFAAFMFRQFYLDFPVEIEEAGRVDGLGYFGIYRRLAIPNSRGILTALGVISFINSWNDFTWPLVIGQSNNMWSVQVDISAFITSQTIILHEVFMGALVAIFPVVIVFLVLQHFIVEGVKLSGVKG